MEYQLSLFARLCFGRNVANIETLSQVVPLEQALHGMKDHTLHGKIRAAYTDLLLTIFVDVEKNQPVLKRIRV